MSDFVDDEDLLAAEQARVRDAELQVQEEIRVLLQERIFRDFMWRILSRCAVYTDGFAPDAATMAFTAGRRNIGLGIIRDLTSVDPLAYARMQEENANERNDD
jgi:hypothetical protein